MYARVKCLATFRDACTDYLALDSYPLNIPILHQLLYFYDFQKRKGDHDSVEHLLHRGLFDRRF